MIKQSFIFLNKVTENKEKKLWQFCNSWNEFLQSNDMLTNAFEEHKKQIEKAKKALYNADQTHFAKSMMPKYHWRLYNDFKDEAVFLDIETTGFRGGTTVVGLYDGINTKIFVRDKNLTSEALQEEINKYKMVVTFNGACFDLPVLTNEYNINFDNHLHMDLRFVCSRIGLKGGLKNIEREIGISRDDEVEEMSGYDAVILWKRYLKTGDEAHLNKLIKYNEEDIINLKTLAEHAVPKRWDVQRTTY